MALAFLSQRAKITKSFVFLFFTNSDHLQQSMWVSFCVHVKVTYAEQQHVSLRCAMS